MIRWLFRGLSWLLRNASTFLFKLRCLFVLAGSHIPLGRVHLATLRGQQRVDLSLHCALCGTLRTRVLDFKHRQLVLELQALRGRRGAPPACWVLAGVCSPGPVRSLIRRIPVAKRIASPRPSKVVAAMQKSPRAEWPRTPSVTRKPCPGVTSPRRGLVRGRISLEGNLRHSAHELRTDSRASSHLPFRASARRRVWTATRRSSHRWQVWTLVVGTGTQRAPPHRGPRGPAVASRARRVRPEARRGRPGARRPAPRPRGPGPRLSLTGAPRGPPKVRVRIVEVLRRDVTQGPLERRSPLPRTGRAIPAPCIYPGAHRRRAFIP